MVRAGTSTLDRPDAIASAVLPLSFRLVAGEEADRRPRVEVRHAIDGRAWTI
jgi:hypothetical protein